MISLADWFPLALTGTVLTLFGCLKLYGLARGMEGGRDKPAANWLCGT
jgi:hypothetical protein